MKTTLVIASLVCSLASANIFADCVTLHTQNNTSYAAFNHNDQNWGAGWTHQANNPYNGNDYFSGCDINSGKLPRSFVGEISFYPAEHNGDANYLCHIVFWSNAHVANFSSPSKDYTCSYVSNGNDINLTFSTTEK